MAENETPQTAAQGGQQNAAPTQEAKAPEWQQKFPGGPDEMWKSYTSLQSKYDKDKTEWSAKSGKPSQQTQAASWDFGSLSEGYGNLSARIDAEAAKGEFSPEVTKLFEAMGADPAFFKDVVQHRITKRFEPVKQYLGEGDHNQMMEIVGKNIDDKSREALQSLIDANAHEAAATLIKGVLAKVQAKGAEPQVGQVSATPGGGYKTFKELSAAMRDARFQWDKPYQEDVKRRFESTPQSVKDEWNKQHAGW